MPANHLALESSLIAALRERVPALRAVSGAADLANIKESAAPSPAVFVLYDGERIGETSHDRRQQVVMQRWLVVLFVKHAGQDGGVALRATAGELLTSIIAALSGFQPGFLFSPLLRVNAPRPGYTPAAGWFPLAYEARVVTFAPPVTP